MARQIIALRNYSLIDEQGEHQVCVKLFRPRKDGADTACEYEISWPHAIQHGHAIGIDAIQAIILALKKIGSDIYFSPHAKAGQLIWLEPDRGFGLPLPKGLEQEYIGDDPP